MLHTPIPALLEMPAEELNGWAMEALKILRAKAGKRP